MMGLRRQTSWIGLEDQGVKVKVATRSDLKKNIGTHKFTNLPIANWIKTYDEMTRWAPASSLLWRVWCTSPFYRAMHVAQKRGIATLSRPSVCPSVCSPVTLMYRWRIGWISSKIITRISLGYSHLGATTSASPRGTPQKFVWIRGGVALISGKPVISLNGARYGPKLLLMTI